jgi:predicted RNase H-like HicB family nuclease/DNA-binding XRE family transcriptional regulator
VFYTAIVTPDAGAFVVTFPDAPGCVTQVDRVEALLPMATDALAGWLDATLDAGDVVPEPRFMRRAPRGSRSIVVPVVPTATALRILLRRARTEEGLTQEAFAERLGMSARVVRRLEGSGANPTLDTLDRVASALNRTLAVGLVREGGAVAYGGRGLRRGRSGGGRV